MPRPTGILTAATVVLLSLTFISGNAFADWQRVRNVEGVVVHTSPHKDSALRDIRGTVTLDAPLSRVLALFSDPAQLVKWIDRLKQARQLSGNRDDFFLYLRFGMPMGTSDRDVVVHFKRNSENPSRVIYKGEKAEGQTARNGAVAMTQFTSTWIFLKKGDKTEVQYTQFSNPGGLLPAVLVMPVATDMVLNTLRGLKKQFSR